jgi:hypothetical protein
MVHPGNWMGSLVGDTERMTRKGFQIIRAHAPCVAVIDEVEKVMPSSRGGDRDGGVGARMEGTFLTEMNDIQEPVFWCFNGNSVDHARGVLPGRAGRRRLLRAPADGRPAGRRLAAVPEEVLPRDVGGKPFPRHAELDVAALRRRPQTGQPQADPAAWAHKFAAALMALAPGEEGGSSCGRRGWDDATAGRPGGRGRPGRRRRLDAGRDPGLLPAGPAAERAAGGGRPPGPPGGVPRPARPWSGWRSGPRSRP